MFLASLKFRFIVIQMNKEKKGKSKEIVSFLFSNDGDMAIRWIESEKDFEYILKEGEHHGKDSDDDDNSIDNENGKGDTP